jgi:16S rRNA (adenine1518-N6/adenine1519-N6)-dimethyltransferase
MAAEVRGGGNRVTHPGQRASLHRLTRDLLAAHGLRPSKRRGQHFLVDPQAAAAIVAAAELAPTDRVLEIGGGLGALTAPLADAAETVVVVELDAGLVRALRGQTQSRANVRVVQGDFLELPMDDLAPPTYGGRWKVVGNLPYSVTSPILERLYAHRERFERFVVTVQREVAERLAARPGTRQYGSLTAFTQYHVDVRAVRTLSREAFLPKPQVESTVLCMMVRPTPPVAVVDEDLLFQVVRGAFAHRRKNLLNSLAAFGGLKMGKMALQDAICAAGVSPEVRGETLSLEQFARLADEIARRTGGP